MVNYKQSTTDFGKGLCWPVYLPCKFIEGVTIFHKCRYTKNKLKKYSNSLDNIWNIKFTTGYLLSNTLIFSEILFGAVSKGLERLL